MQAQLQEMLRQQLEDWLDETLPSFLPATGKLGMRVSLSAFVADQAGLAQAVAIKE